MINNVLELLLSEGCPSIVYRVRKEINQESISARENVNYQNLIYADPKVQKILTWQESDGYFGTRFHTAPSKSKIWSHEGCVRYLLEMGLTKENEQVSKALEVMLRPGWGKECENSRAASTFKYEMIRASLFAQAGCQECEFVAEWVKEALQGFRYIAQAGNYTDLVCERSDKKLVFKDGKYVPVIYRLRLLAYTDLWRTEDNLQMLKKAYKKMYEWLPLPPMYYQSGSYPVAPLGNVSLAVNQSFQMDFGFWWLHFYELSARMGVLGKESPFRKHFEDFKTSVLEQSECIMEYTKGKKGMYVNWSGYSGLALEGDWQTKQEKIRDFIFRILLIDQYSNSI